MKQLIFISLLLPIALSAQQVDKFAQLGEQLPTPNEYRNAAGAPGHNYYQQKADYKINVKLDDGSQKITGEETITYTNNSPDALEYLWIQLDQNVRALDSDTKLISIERMEDFRSIDDVKNQFFYFDGGFKIEEVKSSAGKDLSYFINKTMMRIDLTKPLAPKHEYQFLHQMVVQHQ